MSEPRTGNDQCGVTRERFASLVVVLSRRGFVSVRIVPTDEIAEGRKLAGMPDQEQHDKNGQEPAAREQAMDGRLHRPRGYLAPRGVSSNRPAILCGPRLQEIGAYRYHLEGYG